MSIMLKADTIEIRKPKDIGLVALCNEVAWYVKEGIRPQDVIDLHSARYEEEDNYIKVVFDRTDV